MADFSDEGDRQLVQLAVVYEQAGRRTDWVSVEKDMRPSTWSAAKLQQRIKTLKRRYGNKVLSFPHAISARHQTEQDCIWKPKPRLLYGFRHHHVSPLETYSATGGLFCLLTRRDVRASERQQNAGEITMAGVSMLIEGANIQVNDVFLDAGSGVGNVLAQVALQTQAFCVVGIEIQRDLAARGMELIASRASRFPHLLKISVVAADIRNIAEGSDTVINADPDSNHLIYAVDTGVSAAS
ncbi:hypothetical protein PHYSODRAFT_331547 [Phytophthora sojae]|uniref:DOT1 domain-containing protein n=1 Tax=Phytophthora sojae (strain P6497) TaxID=1094619 RepID=G4ZHE0_PHYSP|nr:hypothetical protein PHYSODRAFT_331547 [Phytophthora sojae]EGZ17610.1 hypothetical protein PHYSODRAFT_331547 [Phytophthora sojae]|eukprot:XP_009526668.1 hypothetical protein PHYSODRAFT_331547 [Phytophthora sojae]